MKPDLLINITVPNEYVEKLGDDFAVHYLPRVAADDPALDGIAGNIRAVLTNGTDGIDAALIERLENLEIISAFGVGCENIDMTAARARGIALTNGAGTNANSVADLAICLMMCASRRIVAADGAARAGQWGDFREPATPTIARRQEVGGPVAAGRDPDLVARTDDIQSRLQVLVSARPTRAVSTGRRVVIDVPDGLRDPRSRKQDG